MSYTLLEACAQDWFIDSMLVTLQITHGLFNTFHAYYRLTQVPMSVDQNLPLLQKRETSKPSPAHYRGPQNVARNGPGVSGDGIRYSASAATFPPEALRVEQHKQPEARSGEEMPRGSRRRLRGILMMLVIILCLIV